MMIVLNAVLIWDMVSVRKRLNCQGLLQNREVHELAVP